MKFGFGLLGGTVGYVYVPKSYKVSCTAEYSHLPGPSRTHTVNGNSYLDTTTLSTLSIRGNYYPVQTAKWFHVSLGLAYSMSNIMLELPKDAHTIGSEEVEDTSGSGSVHFEELQSYIGMGIGCLLYTSPSPRDLSTSRMPSSA